MDKWLITVLLGFSVGVLIRSFYDFGWSFAAMFIFLGLLLFGLFYILKFQKFVLFIGLFFFALGLGILRYGIKDARETALEGQIGSKIVVSGTIIEEPDEKENYTRLILETDKAETKILLTGRRYPIFHYGDKVEVSGILRKPEKFSDFDWPAYLAKDDIYFEMIYPQTKLLQGKGGSRLRRQLFSIKEKFIDNLSKVIPEPDAGYLAGLTIGGKKAMSKDLQEEFRRTGIIHVVVLSGYNVTIIANVIMQALKGLPFFVGIGFGILGILFFALMAGASATVVRASIMAGFALLARATGRVYQITIALLVAGFLMILHNPKILRFDTSFQLSFLATLGLVYLAPRFNKYNWFSRLPNFWSFRDNLAATLSAQIMTLPIILFGFGRFSLIAVLANVLILPVIPSTMLFGFLAGLTGFVSLKIAAIFIFPAWLMLSYQIWVVKILSLLPFASISL